MILIFPLTFISKKSIFVCSQLIFKEDEMLEHSHFWELKLEIEVTQLYIGWYEVLNIFKR